MQCSLDNNSAPAVNRQSIADRLLRYYFILLKFRICILLFRTCWSF